MAMVCENIESDIIVHVVLVSMAKTYNVMLCTEILEILTIYMLPVSKAGDVIVTDKRQNRGLGYWD
jgi:hypothetical protein